jgi:hypothetical protein
MHVLVMNRISGVMVVLLFHKSLHLIRTVDGVAGLFLTHIVSILYWCYMLVVAQHGEVLQRCNVVYYQQYIQFLVRQLFIPN